MLLTGVTLDLRRKPVDPIPPDACDHGRVNVHLNALAILAYPSDLIPLSSI